MFTRLTKRGRTSRARLPAVLVLGLGALVISHGQAPTPPAPLAPGQGPTFKAGVNLVTVDAYPVRDGRIVEGLSAPDFTVLEDGKPQKIESFEFVRIEPTPAAELRDPNTVGESLKLAADPHNRVFVVYLDTHFVRVDGSHSIRLPLVHMLDGILAANDLFGIMVPTMRASDVTLARKVGTVDEELAKYWTWGTRDSIKVQPEGELAIRCYQSPGGGNSPLSDPAPIRPIPGEILQRSYEDLTLQRLEELIEFLGHVREARSSALVVTDGWLLYGRNDALANSLANDGSPAPPGIFVGPGGKLGQGGSRDPTAMGGRDLSSCTDEMLRLARLDDQQRMRDLIAKANRNNVTFDAVNPSGLSAGDANPASMSFADQTTLAATSAGGNLVSALMDNLQSRIDTLLALTRNTDGIAVVNTNDLAGGLKRIVDENSAYYLLGYYSTNTKLDGKYRRIDVHVDQPKIHIAARRGYTAGTESDAIARAPAPARSGPSPLDDALASLTAASPDAELVVGGAASPDSVTVVVEIASRPIELGQWSDGGEAQVRLIDASGKELPVARGTIAAGMRSVAVTVPVPPGATGPWTARATVTSRDGSIEDRATLRVPSGPLLGAPLMSRGTPSAHSMLLPVADSRFRRTERVHVEWPVLKPLDQREARLLGRDGQPLTVNVTVTEREIAGHPTVAADAVLGPLAPGDYVIELVAGSGAEHERQLVAIRIIG